MEEFKEIKGRLLSSKGRVKIFEGFPHCFYEIEEPKFNAREKVLADLLIGVISRKLSFSELQKRTPEASASFVSEFRNKIVNFVESEELVDKLPSIERMQEMQQYLNEFIKKNASFVQSNEFLEFVLDYSIGFGEFGVLLRDEKLEEIMVNGYNKNAFVFHTSFGMCKTNIKIAEEGKQIFLLVNRIAKSVGKTFSSENPLLDARLPDGNRANATFPYATPFGPTLTIRKFTKIPLSIVDLIANNTLSSELAAFLWLMVEGFEIEPMNVIITGGASSGKTTTLNCLASFIRHSDRIVSIEDTLELHFGSRENWVQMESRLETKESREVTMDDLLKNALRMRPDRLVVGEVRGKEAQTLFVAMDTGHSGILGTLHANNAQETMLRLKAEPMSVPEAMLPLLDLIVVMYRQYSREKGIIRRIGHVAEVSRMNEKVLLSNVFEWNRKTDRIVKSDVPSRVLEVLAEKTTMNKREIMQEGLVRQRILEWMIENNITSQPEVEKIIQGYYYNPKFILEKVSEGLK